MYALRTLLAATALLGAASAAASAAPLAVINQGESFAVEYAAGYAGNIVGGGFVRLEGNNRSLRIIHEDPSFARRAVGIPVFTGGSEGDVAYLPVGSANSSLAAR
ncbi:hypothetical protein EBE87_03435 [Pseudoroseomonas wenyumeiae]|uniref:Uncharacterized protein n=1 Tax=Teichococcus wenyumeiae TaxID=2478470 RepID=A0A3A9JEZ9_9PROT|nr:hypothetical protein [Pseudoroseomonas wenyumeiae]RKK03941.1 hypothetical protein D6Z83_11895 [Pseudoroseomonas wenyumeiae]RMI26351.1 hypothetical protein EBE87_03435 [Pseudoroseomonas wenyumeiae]